MNQVSEVSELTYCQRYGHAGLKHQGHSPLPSDQCKDCIFLHLSAKDDEWLLRFKMEEAMTTFLRDVYRINYDKYKNRVKQRQDNNDFIEETQKTTKFICSYLYIFFNKSRIYWEKAGRNIVKFFHNFSFGSVSRLPHVKNKSHNTGNRNK